MVDAVDQERKAEDVRQENEFLVLVSLDPRTLLIACSYLSDIRAHLTGPREELDTSHPFAAREANLARKVVEVRDQALEDVFHARVGLVGVDQVDIVGDVVGIEIFQWWNLDLGGVHDSCICFEVC